MAHWRIGRIIGITAFLAALGGIAGALGGVAIMTALAVALSTGTGGLANALEGGSVIGFASGLLIGPAFAWILLRRAPIWRAIGETAVAAGIAGTIAIVLAASIPAAVAWASGASLLAALRLRRAYRPTEHARIPADTTLEH